MKKSLIWRFVIILSILLAWTFSLFPITDKPFYEVLRAEAKDKVDSKLEEVINRAKEIDNSNEGSFVTPARAVADASKELNVKS